MSGIITREEILEAAEAIRDRSNAALPAGTPASHEEAEAVASAASSGLDLDPDELVQASLSVVPPMVASGFCTGVTVGLEIAARRARSEANEGAQDRA